MQSPQAPNPVQVSTGNAGAIPIYRVTVIARTTKAINYNHRSGPTRIDFRGTPLLPEARGEARVESKQGVIKIDARMEKLQPATKFGSVMWAITPVPPMSVKCSWRRQDQTGCNNGVAVVRLDCNRGTLFRGDTTERRRGHGEFRSAGYDRDD